jgi:hypothetical protein
VVQDRRGKDFERWDAPGLDGRDVALFVGHSLAGRLLGDARWGHNYAESMAFLAVGRTFSLLILVLDYWQTEPIVLLVINLIVTAAGIVALAKNRQAEAAQAAQAAEA